MKQRLYNYLLKRYGSICSELQYCLNRMEFNQDFLQEAINEVSWQFCCEWNCGLDEWHTDFLKQEINK